MNPCKAAILLSLPKIGNSLRKGRAYPANLPLSNPTTAEKKACEEETKTAKREPKEAKWEAEAKADRDRTIENLKLQMSSQREARVRFSDEPY